MSNPATDPSRLRSLVIPRIPSLDLTKFAWRLDLPVARVAPVVREAVRPFDPSPLDEAEWMGMSLRLAGEPMAELPTGDASVAMRFSAGQYRGLMEAVREREGRDADLWT